MPQVVPSPQNPVVGKIAQVLTGTRNFLDAIKPGRGGYHGVVPQTPGTPLGQQLLGKAPEEVTEWSYGNSPFKDKPIPGVGNLLPELQERRIQQVADALMLLPLVPGSGESQAALGNFRKLAHSEIPPGRVPVFRGTMRQKEPGEPYSPRTGKTHVFSTNNPITALTYVRPELPKSHIVSGTLPRPALRMDAQFSEWSHIPKEALPRELAQLARIADGDLLPYYSTDDLAELMSQGGIESLEIGNIRDVNQTEGWLNELHRRHGNTRNWQSFLEALRAPGAGHVGPVFDTPTAEPNMVYIAYPDLYDWRHW